MSIRLNEVPALYLAFQQRWNDRDERMSEADSVIRGEWEALGADDDALENRSPNLVQVALEDTAEAASLMPTPRVWPSDPSDAAKKRAAAMERLAISYMGLSKYRLTSIESLMHLAGFGFFPWVVYFDPESGSPVIETRDPRTCYPEPGWRPGDSVRTCMFSREVYVRQLPPEYRAAVSQAYNDVRPVDASNVIFLDRKVTLVEVFEEDKITLVAMYKSGDRQVKGGITWHPVLLERSDTPGGICPVVIGQRPTFDGEPRGQFDQIIGVMQAHIRLMAMVLDYADQAVYSDVWVKDLVGQMSVGGGAYIQLGPQGAIGRVPPAVSSLQVENQLDHLVDAIHIGGRWPKSRPGEIDQAIASAKFMEASAGMMNTVIRTMHIVMSEALEQAIRICFKVDVELGKDRTVAGVLRNQQFLAERLRSDIDLKANVSVEYGMGLGRDPAQSMVLAIQGMQTGMFSKEFVMENFEGIHDVEKERQRLDAEQFRDMAMAMLLQGLQSGEIPKSALVKIAKARMNGAEVFDLFDKFIVKPQEEAAAAAIPSGLGMGDMQPGPAPVGPGGPQAPTAPDGASVLAGLLGGGGAPAGPGAAPPPETISRLSVPLGNGSFMGSQT